jgi:magnesium chelatase subunit ChlI-like protein
VSRRLRKNSTLQYDASFSWRVTFSPTYVEGLGAFMGSKETGRPARSQALLSVSPPAAVGYYKGQLWQLCATDNHPKSIEPRLDRLKSVRFFVHDVIMIGPPGASKTLLARAMPGILPAMSIDNFNCELTLSPECRA